VARPPTDEEYFLYGQPQPPYVGYLFENKVWRRIPFTEIPVEIYDTNLSIDSENYIHLGQITLHDKANELLDPRMPESERRLSPIYENGAFPKNPVKIHQSR
jgi:hypothetical protein